MIGPLLFLLRKLVYRHNFLNRLLILAGFHLLNNMGRKMIFQHKIFYARQRLFNGRGLVNNINTVFLL
jgi:hypothetical protein